MRIGFAVEKTCQSRCQAIGLRQAHAGFPGGLGRRAGKRSGARTRLSGLSCLSIGPEFGLNLRYGFLQFERLSRLGAWSRSWAGAFFL